jgi:uridine phosphorylase
VYHLGLRADEIAEHLFLVGDPGRADVVAGRFDRVDHEVRHREFVTITGVRHGVPVSVIGTGIGPDNVEIALVEAWALLALDPATGRRRTAGLAQTASLTAIRIGTSGGLREDVAVGTLVISSYAVGLDSTGFYYEAPPADDTVTALEQATKRAVSAGMRLGSRFASAIAPYASRATPAVVSELENAARRLGVPAVTGATVTAPGFFGPSGRHLDGVTNTVPEIKQRLGRIEAAGVGVYNMEMESSLLFHLGGLLGIRTGTICPTLSNPSGHARLLDPAAAVDRAIDVALAAMESVARGPE